MKAEFLLDANVLVYAHDRSEPDKQGRAATLLDELAPLGAAALTTQVLGEFFWVATRRLPAPLGVEAAVAQVERFSRVFEVLPITRFVLMEALRGVRERGTPLWDAQIWAAARLNQIPVVLSEDFASGSVIEGVRFENPFSPRFALF